MSFVESFSKMPMVPYARLCARFLFFLGLVLASFPVLSGFALANEENRNLIAPAAGVSEMQAVQIRLQEDLNRLKEGVAVCALTSENSERLHCYDRISVREGLMSEDAFDKVEEEIARFGFWTVTIREDAFGRDGISLKLDSHNQITTLAGSGKRPSLVVRCRGRNTDVYMDWPGPLGHSEDGYLTQSITYGVDPQSRREEPWELSKDRYGLFAYDPAGFIREIRGRDRVVFEVAPPNDSIKSVTFKLDGFESALQFLIDRCYKD